MFAYKDKRKESGSKSDYATEQQRGKCRIKIIYNRNYNAYEHE